MNLKDKLVRKLLDAGKKHRILVYPTLALIAIISAISHAVYWGRGNGKKLVASAMVMVMLITQSLFLTSSADVMDDSPNAGIEGYSEQNVASPSDASVEVMNMLNEPATAAVVPSDYTVSYYRVDESGNIHPVLTAVPVVVVKNADGTAVDHYEVPAYTDAEIFNAVFGSEGYATQGAYIAYSGLYFDRECTSSIGDGKLPEGITPTNGAYSVYFKMTRNSYPVSIHTYDDNYVTSTITLPSTTTGDIYPDVDYIVPHATAISEHKLYRYGYTYAGVEFAGGDYAPDAIIHLTPDANNPLNTLNLEAKWTPMEFTSTFNAIVPGFTPSKVTLNQGATDGQVETYTYGEMVTLPGPAEMWAGNEAYTVVGWNDESGNRFNVGQEYNSSEFVKKDADGNIIGNITDSLNVTSHNFTAVWSYKNIMINATDDGSTADDGRTVALTGTYGNYVRTELSARYRDDTSASFIYDISSEDAKTLGKYGLSVRHTELGGLIIEGTLEDITPSSGVIVNLTVTDERVDEDDTENLRVSNYPITLVSNRRPVSINPDSVKNESGLALSREYNGSDIISVAQTIQVNDFDEAAGTGKLETDDVYVKVSPTAIVDPNAGKGKDITLKGVTLTGTSSDKYVLTDLTEGSTDVVIPGVAEITRKSMEIGIKLVDPSKENILFGEATPEIALYLIEPEKLVDADRQVYEAYTTDADRTAFIAEKIGYQYIDTSRVLYSPTGTYTLKPVFDGTGKNYVAIADGLSVEFGVGRENGVQYTEATADSANFRLSTSKGSNGYYPGLSIAAYGKYDKIRRIDSASGDLTPDMTKEYVEGTLFTDSTITLEDMVDKTVYFQMLDSETGAVSNIVTLTNVCVDTTWPELDTYSITPAKDTYFKEFSFGSYYHSQKIDGRDIETVTFTFNYTSEGSDCDSLYYTFVDEKGNPISDKATEVKFTKNGLANNLYTCSFTIGTGKYGQLIVYATDTTGNKSVPVKIKLNSYDAFDSATETPENYYEWMIENTLEVSTIVALDGEAEAITGVWYNELTLKVDAEDSESGLDKIIWTVTGPDGYSKNYEDIATDTVYAVKKDYGKVTECTFVHNLTDAALPAGAYTISAVLEDNAGNKKELEAKGPFWIDTNKPVITDNTDMSSTAFESSVTLDFTVTERADESGLESVSLYVLNGEEKLHVKSWSIAEAYTYEIYNNGIYVIEAVDKAGNVSTLNLNFSNISNVAPIDPVIDVEGTKGNSDWYIEAAPEITITYADKTVDGIDVESYYTVTTVNGNHTKEKEMILNPSNAQFNVDTDGTVSIKAWSESASGKLSNVVTTEFKVDTEAPKVEITDSATNENGDTVINFRVTDATSGVNIDKVMINGTPIEVFNDNGAVTGSFVVTDNAVYKITAEDIAGNLSEAVEYKPLAIDVRPITDITSSEAYLEAYVYEGSCQIEDAYISIKKEGETSYSSCLYNKNEEEYGLSMNCLFRNLVPDTVYWYKVYAKAKTSGEVKIYEGSFKTTDDKATGSVKGSVVYGENVTEQYPIYVSLYKANTIVATKVIEDITDKNYLFEKVSDGAYNVVATDGLYTKTSSVIVENGGITYPTDYAIQGGVNFILNGMSTSVVIEDNAINIAADGLDDIYNSTWYEGNITRADKDVLDAGGTIDISLHASYINVSDLSNAELTVFDTKMDNVVIERYISLSVVKEVRDAEGRLVNGTPTYIPELLDEITISFPLGELSGQKIYVASVHGSGNNYSFVNWDKDDEVTLSKNFVTIRTKKFSVYALYRKLAVEKEYTVKWIDGDGKVMKTEKVKDGKAATPPTQIPTKKASATYTYQFSGWDTEYDSITQDTVIAAWFTAHKITNKDTNTDNKPAPDTTVTPSTPTTDANKNHYTYMGSADSPQTGDAMPIMILVLLMGVSMAGICILKKIKE